MENKAFKIKLNLVLLYKNYNIIMIIIIVIGNINDIMQLVTKQLLDTQYRTHYIRNMGSGRRTDERRSDYCLQIII